MRRSGVRLQAQPRGLKTRVVDAGCASSFAAGRSGRGSSSPPQFGQVPASRFEAQSAQKVHSKEQIRACRESGGRSMSQHSHEGRSSSMRYSDEARVAEPV
jgi:hypothetical protein